MHVDVFYVFWVGAPVGFGGETGEAFFVNEDAQRINASQHHINPQIKLQLINQQRTRYILLRHKPLIQINILPTIHQKNPLSLRRRLRLQYKSPLLPLIKLKLKIREFGRQDPGLGEKVIGLRETSLKSGEIVGEVIFPRDKVSAGEMVHFLIRFHPSELFWRDGVIDSP